MQEHIGWNRVIFENSITEVWMLTLLMVVLVAEPALALPPRDGAKVGVGLGGGLGVSGLSGKFWLSDGNALQVVLGIWGAGRDVFGYGYAGSHGVGYGAAASVDYLWEMPILARAEPVIVAWNLGVGGSVGATEPAWLGASGVAGLEFDFQPVPIDLVIEYRPGFSVLPGFGPDLVNFTGHVRVHF